ncbi:MAG TPA: iron-molybdenum cofactor-binding protein [Sulfurovum sp. UBA12169]|nr:MAG TPA: iron-molybdenum cofactor-binding protein [Sulfurovum sp. UBA12169]
MRVAFPTNNEETIAKHIGLCKKIVIYVDGEKIEVIENPILKMVKEENLPIAKEGERHFGTGRMLSKFLSEKGVDMFAAIEFYSRGLKQNLEQLAITPYETQEKDIETVLHMLGEKGMFANNNKNNEKGEEMYAKKGLGAMQGRGVGRGRGMGLGRNERRGEDINTDYPRDKETCIKRGLGAMQGRGTRRGHGMGRGRGAGSL